MPPTVKTLASVRVGSFTFDATPVAEKIPSEALLEARYLLPEALGFQLGAFRVDFVKVGRSDYECNVVILL